MQLFADSNELEKSWFVEKDEKEIIKIRFCSLVSFGVNGLSGGNERISICFF